MTLVKKVLFVGNSFTKHAPAPDIGWHGDWGMAASGRENDYAHVMLRLFEKAGIQVQSMIRNIADFERGFWDYDYEHLREMRDFGADIIIMRIAENVSEEDAAAHGFEDHYQRLIDFLNPGGHALVVCSNGFGDHENVNRMIESAAHRRGYPFADISMLFYNDENKALGNFENEAVAAHPSDTGMSVIANILFSLVMQSRFRNTF